MLFTYSVSLRWSLEYKNNDAMSRNAMRCSTNLKEREKYFIFIARNALNIFAIRKYSSPFVHSSLKIVRRYIYSQKRKQTTKWQVQGTYLGALKSKQK